MRTQIKVNEIKVGQTFPSDLLLDGVIIATPRGVPVSNEILNLLKDYYIEQVFYTQEVQEKKESVPPTPTILKPSPISPTPSAAPIPSVSFASPPSSPSFVSNVEVLKDTPAPSSIKVVDDPLIKAVKHTDSSSDSEEAILNSVKERYKEFITYIYNLYMKYATDRIIDVEELEKKAKELCIYIKDYKKYVLRLSPSVEDRAKNFLVIHSLRTAVLAVTMAMELKMEMQKVVELCISSILHEIGMLRIPPQLYMSSRSLTPIERNYIVMHPIFSFNIVKELGFPAPVQMAVLEHHEKENGKGYPRHLAGDKISLYAKIINVACSYEAITAPRTYKTARTPFDAMVEMLGNPDKQYDTLIIKALVCSLSLYPIGAYVFLTNGKIALVVDVNPSNPRLPIVRLLNEKDESGALKTIQTDDKVNKISRVLSKKEQQDIIKATMMQAATKKTATNL